MEIISLSPALYKKAVQHLVKNHSAIANLLTQYGTPPFIRRPAGFAGLVHTIVAQQVSSESARSVYNKLSELMPVFSPSAFLELDSNALQSSGLSRQKTQYITGIADEIVSGKFDIGGLQHLPDDTAAERLLELRGIGHWTAYTYLLFSLCRADVWPSGDLALEKIVSEIENSPSKLDRNTVDRIAMAWKPYRSVAARILWHSYRTRRNRQSTDLKKTT
jgi:DNA-3-methyladenine glycosylase II